MKHILILLLFVLVGCSEPNIKKLTTGMVYSKTGHHVELYRFGNCMYIGKLTGTQSDWASHCGECDNPIHRYSLNTDTIQ